MSGYTEEMVAAGPSVLAFRCNRGADVVLLPNRLSAQRFRGRDAQLLMASGCPYLTFEDTDGGARPGYIRVPEWAGRLWVKLPHGEEVRQMERLLGDEDLREAACSVLDLASNQSEALDALLDAYEARLAQGSAG